MKKNTEKKKRIVIVLLLLLDVWAINLSSFFALWLRFDLSFTMIPKTYLITVFEYAILHTFFTIGILFFFKLYTCMWRFVGILEAVKIFFACSIAIIVQWIGMQSLGLQVPKSFYPVSLVILIAFEAVIRFSYRVLSQRPSSKTSSTADPITNVMIIGAGCAGTVIMREIATSAHLNKRTVCIIDDDPGKRGRTLFGCPIAGDKKSIIENVEKYKVQEIIIAIPSATRKQMKDILDICSETDCNLLVLPGIYQLVNGDVNFSTLRNVKIEDLLCREHIEIDLSSIMDYVSDKVVLVTGGGGSIGSELCRQLASYKPQKLIIFDIYENNAYELQQELERSYPDLNILVLIGSVRDRTRMNDLFRTYRPQIVYHAAAHKHVPLMESCPEEAIKNNVFGTYNTALSASKYGTDKFVLISSDKAVNPTNIMGASKRICEMIIQTMAKNSDTEFVAVRFGNVLGSNGSVIPLFQKQIEQGDPVTVTHPDIERFFMTISEAVSLVLQAGSYAKGGEIFVLDMGEPVKIKDLAENLIRLSGYKPHEDIEIIYTGLRPGEKLFEEFLLDEEGMQRTDNKLIYIGSPIEIDEVVFARQLRALEALVDKTADEIRCKVQEIVPTYRVHDDDFLDPRSGYTACDDDSLDPRSGYTACDDDSLDPLAEIDDVHMSIIEPITRGYVSNA